MTELGIILIGTGLMVFFAGRVIVKKTDRMIDQSSLYEALSGEKKNKEIRLETDFSRMVHRAMKILYIVGITCISVGVILLIFFK